jgi:hypothetical protein
MTDRESVVYDRGDVVFGADPFRRGESGRPWLVVSNHETKPFHGDQYITLPLTTRSWLDGLISAPEERWVRGGVPRESRIVPWGVQSLDHEDTEFWQGTLERAVVGDAVTALTDYLD